VKWQEVQAALPDSAMALEFVHFRINFPQKTDSIMYAALLLRPGTAQPLFIPLFEEKEFDHLLSADRERKADYVNELYNWADRSMVQLGRPKKSLNDLIWSKIEDIGLEGIKTVYYSPSGVLHRLNLGAITIDEDAILSDRYNLVALNSTRQLVIPSTITTRANDALLVGGVNFEVESTLSQLADEPHVANTRGATWSFLKWTEKEVANITTSLTTEGFNSAKLTGNDATENTFKAIGTEGASPRVLHIATHGFFFPDPELAPSFRRGLGEVEPVFKSPTIP
jgi:CHAT domain-containing protein